jgi:hypothetical protein
MHKVAGAILILSASILIAVTRLASRMPGPAPIDDGTINAILILAALVLGLFGLGIMWARIPLPGDGALDAALARGRRTPAGP